MRFSSIQNTFFFGLLALATIAMLYTTQSFLQPIFWAIVIGIVFYPVYRKIQKTLKTSDIYASLITVFIIITVIVIPLYTVSVLVANEAIDTYKSVSSSSYSTSQILEKFSGLNTTAKTLGIHTNSIDTNISEIIKKAVSYIGREAINLGKNTANIIVQFFIVLYLLFFVFKDGKSAIKKVREILPLGDKRERIIFAQFASIVRAIFKGTIIIALMQGAMAGLLFYIAGINAVLLWTVLMTILAIIPAVGPGLVLIPTGIIFLASNNMWQGILLIAGAILISVVDNIARPMLVGKDIKLHDVIITVSMLGGLAVFGFSGLIIGPIVAGFFFTMWGLFENDYKKELKERG